MKRYLFGLAIALLTPVSQAAASNVDFNVGVNIGVPAAPVYVNPPVAIDGPPEFVAPPQLGFYVAVGVPYDLFYFGNRYYLCRGNGWHAAPYYNGPWVSIGYRDVPYGLRRFPMGRVHYYRDGYYKRYHNYGGQESRHFRPARHEFSGEGHGRGGEGHGRRDR